MIKKLSILIPLFNEEKTVEALVKKVLAVKFPCDHEIVIVNDGSTNQSDKIALRLVRGNKTLKYFKHSKNQGKGAAIRTALSEAKGDYAVIQDADLEYDPGDIVKLLERASRFPSKVIYGSRLTAPPVLFGRDRTPLLIHYFGNRFLSFITSLLFQHWVTDMETCYKLFPVSALKDVKLNARGFELEPELTAKFLKRGWKILEVPITTKPRGYQEGKKIRAFRDGYKALLALLKYRFTD